MLARSWLMSGPDASSRMQADHWRELAFWTSDERAHRILMEMANELEVRRDYVSPSDDPWSEPLPRSLS